MTAASVVLDIVRTVIAKVAGKKAGDITADNVAAAITDKVMESMAATIRVELERYQAALGMVFATRDLAEAAYEVLSSMREAARSTSMPNILDGADVQEMPAGWVPEDEVTKPGGEP